MDSQFEDEPGAKVLQICARDVACRVTYHCLNLLFSFSFSWLAPGLTFNLTLDLTLDLTFDLTFDLTLDLTLDLALLNIPFAYHSLCEHLHPRQLTRNPPIVAHGRKNQMSKDFPLKESSSSSSVNW